MTLVERRRLLTRSNAAPPLPPSAASAEDAGDFPEASQDARRRGGGAKLPLALLPAGTYRRRDETTLAFRCSLCEGSSCSSSFSFAEAAEGELQGWGIPLCPLLEDVVAKREAMKRVKMDARKRSSRYRERLFSPVLYGVSVCEMRKVGCSNAAERRAKTAMLGLFAMCISALSLYMFGELWNAAQDPRFSSWRVGFILQRLFPFKSAVRLASAFAEAVCTPHGKEGKGLGKLVSAVMGVARERQQPSVRLVEVSAAGGSLEFYTPGTSFEWVCVCAWDVRPEAPPECETSSSSRRKEKASKEEEEAASPSSTCKRAAKN
ncbi:hypothetical protein cyc_02702 [Cyclospora cayetanensis]|uniref:Transmembrane protein n=1 Tax=Cyclospora cayetanensis TaxID=88456 RepID=A0A1D3CY61_9EIME|nr:hypothetical protein cyc_02702 [Cyclospora cayetanensis]